MRISLMPAKVLCGIDSTMNHNHVREAAFEEAGEGTKFL